MPLTIDQVMTKLDVYSELDWSHPRPDSGEIITVETYDALVQAQRRWLACKLYGTPFHVWALEANRLVREDVLALNAGTTGPRVSYHPDAIRSDLEALLQEVGTEVSSEPIDPGIEYFAVADPDYSEGWYNRQYGDIAADITVYWVNAEGAYLQAPGMNRGDPDAEAFPFQLNFDLYNIMRFAYDDANNVWLVHSFEYGGG